MAGAKTPPLVRPRFFSVPKDHGALGKAGVAFARRHGLNLDVEQEALLVASLGTRADGRWAAAECGINEPRQNGKGEVLLVRELFGLYELGERQLVHSAHEFKTSSKHFARVEDAVRGSKELLGRVATTGPSRRVTGFRYSHGEESLELDTGERIEFRTRTRSGMRGFDDVYVLVLDEAMIYPEEAHGSMLPTVRASKAPRGAQIWYTGSAADQSVHNDAIVWARIRERGMAGDPGLMYAEWSLGYDSPEEVPDHIAEDPVLWRTVNPAMVRGRILEEHMRLELRSLGRRQFVVELLGVGDWPVTDGSVERLISDEAWAAILDEGSTLEDPVCIAFDVSPQRRTTIAAAGSNGAGKMHVEIIEDQQGTTHAAERLHELYLSHNVREIVCDGMGPSVAIAARLSDMGVELRRTTSFEYAEACGLFVDHVAEDLVRHGGDEALTAAVRGARARPLVDRWAWSRSKSAGNVGPLIAGSLALWSAVTCGVANRDFVIY